MTDQEHPRTLTGQCLCGAVRYAVPDAFTYAMICHCTDCRRATGSFFKPFAGISRAKLTLTEGADNLLIHGEPDAGDIHCKSCGSMLYSVVRDGAFVHVTMGTLTEEPTIRPSVHIFVRSKVPWYAIGDDMPQFDEHAG